MNPIFGFNPELFELVTGGGAGAVEVSLRVLSVITSLSH